MFDELLSDEEQLNSPFNDESYDEPQSNETIMGQIYAPLQDVGIDPLAFIGINDVSGEIPKRIFQTHKSIEFVKSSKSIINAINSWRRYVPEFEYYFFTDDMCRDFMKNIMTNEFGYEVYIAYTLLPDGAMKADLWRYCAIYHYGGIYADVDTICRCNPNILIKLKSNLVCSPEENEPYLAQWCFSAVKKSPILKEVIEQCITRVIRAVKPFSVASSAKYLTGAGVFTDSVEAYLRRIGFKTFDDKEKYWVYKNREILCFKVDVFQQKMVKHIGFGSWLEE